MKNVADHENPLIFIILDAFRGDYISPAYTPTLYRMKDQGIHIKKIKSSAGFAERAPILTGAPANITNYFTAFCLDEKHSLLRFLKPFKRILSFFTRINIINRLIRAVIYELGRFLFLKGFITSYIATGFIPFELLPEIATTEDRVLLNKRNALSVESILDICYEKDISFDFFLHPFAGYIANDAQMLREILKKLHLKKQLYFFQFIDTDHEIHINGVDSQVKLEVLKTTDRYIAEILQEANNLGLEPTVFIIGDHGMMDVQTKVNIFKFSTDYLRHKGCILWKDYKIFLDSTLARFWYRDESVARYIRDFLRILEKHNLGKIITKSLAREFKIPYKNPLYGQIIFWTEPGVLISPDYFWNKSPKAMHGWNPNHEEMMGCGVLTSPDIAHEEINQIDIEDICPTLCSLLGIRVPSKCLGRSIL